MDNNIDDLLLEEIRLNKELKKVKSKIRKTNNVNNDIPKGVRLPEVAELLYLGRTGKIPVLISNNDNNSEGKIIFYS